MTVDETILDQTCLDLESKLATNDAERRTLKYLLRDARNIQQLDVPDPSPQDLERTKKEMPKDPILKVTISDSRRQEIYDKIMADMVTL